MVDYQIEFYRAGGEPPLLAAGMAKEKAPLRHSRLPSSLPPTTRTYRHLRRKIEYNIHVLRDEQKMTLRKLSSLTNLPPWLLDQYELGKGDIPLLHMLRIAGALNANILDLLC